MPRVLSESEFEAVKRKVLDSLPVGLSEADFTRAVGPRMAAALAEAENTPATPEGSALGRFASNAADVLNPLQLIQAVAHPIETVKGIAAASIDQAQQARNAAAMGRYSEAIGHGAAAVLPILGPAAAQAGEQIASGDVAGGLGRGGALLAPFGVQKALELRNVPNPRLAEMTTRAAEDQVAGQVLAPGNPKFKGRAAAISPEVLARKLSGGREELRQAAIEGMDEAGGRIDAVIQQAGGAKAPVPLMPIIAKLQQRIKDLSDSNGVPISGAAARRVNAIKERIVQLQSLNKSGVAAFEDIKKLRDESYRLADEARGYERQGNPAMSDEGWAARETGGVIRETLAQRFPQLAMANADYTFWKTLDEVLDPVIGRPKNMAPSQGVTGGARTVGAITGQLFGGKAGAFIGGTVLPWLKEHVSTPAWQLADAQSKMRLAEGMRKGDVGLMKSAMVTIEQYGKTTSPNESQTETTIPGSQPRTIP